jgi:hypothetical protein
VLWHGPKLFTWANSRYVECYTNVKLASFRFILATYTSKVVFYSITNDLPLLRTSAVILKCFSTILFMLYICKPFSGITQSINKIHLRKACAPAVGTLIGWWWWLIKLHLKSFKDLSIGTSQTDSGNRLYLILCTFLTPVAKIEDFLV